MKTTTVKVQTSTRDLLMEVGATRRESADQVIRAALTALRKDERRRLAAVEAAALRDDPDELAELQALREDVATLLAD